MLREILVGDGVGVMVGGGEVGVLEGTAVGVGVGVLVGGWGVAVMRVTRGVAS